jgi:hypothetical protein
VLVDDLEDDELLADVEADAVERLDAEDERLGRGVDLERLGPSIRDAPLLVLGQNLAGEHDRAQSDVESACELLLGEHGGTVGGREHRLGPVAVQSLDELRERSRHAEARATGAEAAERGEDLLRDVQRSRRSDADDACCRSEVDPADRAVRCADPAIKLGLRLRKDTAPTRRP